MVVGCMFSGFGCHAKSKCAKLSYELYYVILFWLWILSAFCGNIHVPWILSAFCGNIHIQWILSAFLGYIHILWVLSALATSRATQLVMFFMVLTVLLWQWILFILVTLRSTQLIMSVLSFTFTHLVKVTGARLINHKSHLFAYR